MRLCRFSTEAVLKTVTPLIALVVALFLAAPCPAAGEKEPLYAVAVLNTPVLNTPDFAGVFGGRTEDAPRRQLRPHPRAGVHRPSRHPIPHRG